MEHAPEVISALQTLAAFLEEMGIPGLVGLFLVGPSVMVIAIFALDFLRQRHTRKDEEERRQDAKADRELIRELIERHREETLALVDRHRGEMTAVVRDLGEKHAEVSRFYKDNVELVKTTQRFATDMRDIVLNNPNGGSSGSAVFVGQGRLTVQTMRQVNTVTYTHIDPLAQTFTLDAAAQICGLDLWFTAKGGETRVQIREVQNGVPTRVILAEAVLQPEQIVVSGGGHTRALFPTLVQLLAGTEYAVVVLCNDPTTAVAIAEMGKFDATAQKWVASQPYTVGVLLSSSNASTWTAHQDKDLTFRLLEAGFVPGVTQIDMGSAEVDGATDIVVLSLEETPTADTRIEYELTLPDGNTLLMGSNQPVRLATPVDGAIAVKAKLAGNAKAAPLLWPGAQLLSGAVSQSDDYFSRSIPATGATKAMLIYNALIPSGATVTPEIQVDGGDWEALEQSDAVPQGDGVVEYSFEHDLSEANLAKVRFLLTGTSAARPRVSLIRFMAIK